MKGASRSTRDGAGRRGQGHGRPLWRTSLPLRPTSSPERSPAPSASAKRARAERTRHARRWRRAMRRARPVRAHGRGPGRTSPKSGRPLGVRYPRRAQHRVVGALGRRARGPRARLHSRPRSRDRPAPAEPSPWFAQKRSSPESTERSRRARRSGGMDLNSIHVKSTDRGCCGGERHQRRASGGDRRRDRGDRPGAARLDRRALDALPTLGVPLPGRAAPPARSLCHLDAPRRRAPGDHDPQRRRGAAPASHGGGRSPSACARRRTRVLERGRSGQRAARRIL